MTQPSAAPREPGEQADLRTAASRTVLNDDGTFTAEIFTGAVHFRDTAGDWQPIDSELVEDKDGYAWRNAGNAFSARFKDELDDDAVRFEVAGEDFTLTLDGPVRKKVKVAAGTLTYEDAFEGVDVQYEVLAGGIKETLLLDSADAPTEYTFRLEGLDRADLQAEELADGSVAVAAAGVPGIAFLLAPPYAMDADDGETSTPLADPNASMAVKEQGGDLIITLGVDEDWLSSDARRFPVRLDPTITIQPSVEDASFTSPATCGNCGAFLADRLYIGGADDHVWRAALKYDVGAVPAGVTITDANLEMLYDGYCISATNPEHCGGSGYPVDLHRMTAAWTTSSSPSSLAFGATADASHSFTRTNGWMGWDVTDLVSEWSAGTQANHGVLIKRRTEALSNSGPVPPGRRYAADGSLRPRLLVTYVSDAVSLAAPTLLHANGAELAWSPFAPPSGAPFSRYEVHRSADPNFTPGATTLLTTIGDADVTSFRDTTARPQAAFTYRVVANTSPSNAVTVTLPAAGRSSIFLQPGPADAKVSWLYQWRHFNVCGNHGSDEALWVGASADAVHRPILEFDLRDVPTDAEVEAATLSLWHDTHFQQSVTVDVHRLTRAWTEGAVNGCNGQGADWYETVGGSDWSASGGDYAAMVSASISAPNGQAPSWDDFNVAGLVQSWVDGAAPNLGFLLKIRDEAAVPDRAFRYNADDYSVSPTLRPKLAITYIDGSQAQAPHVTLSSPAAGARVGGNAVALSANASDDRRVERVNFLLDGNLIASDSSAPYGITWNASAVSSGTHILSASAVDDAGNAATSTGNQVTVDNSAPPTTSVTAPANNATVSGTAVTVSANAADDVGVSRVEFYVDDIRIGEDASAPYSISWNTLNPDLPFYDGAHVVTSRAYDGGGKVTASAAVNVTLANRTGIYKATFALAGGAVLPTTMAYDPGAAQQTAAGTNLTITNTSTSTWSDSSVFVRYRWFGPGHSAATPNVVVGPNVALGGDVRKNDSVTLNAIAIAPPTLPDGMDRAAYRLEFDLFDSSANKYFGEQGNQPLDNPVIVNKILRTKLGLERFHQYHGTDVGAGMGHLVAWIKPDDVVRDQMFFTTGGSNYLRLLGGEPFASINIAGVGQTTVDSNFDLVVGQTYFVVATYRPSEGLRIYVNGELKATNPNQAGSGWRAVSSNAYTRIGRWIDTDVRSFDGVIDEVSVFGSALSAQQIRELYSSGVNGSGTDLFLTTTLAYEDLPADAADVAANWQTGRDIEHLSQLATRTDPNGTATAAPSDDYQWSFDYDAEGNLTTVSDPAGFDTTYGYYANGNLQTATDANLKVTTFNTYDPSGQPTKITDAAGGITQFGYDSDGLLRWVQDANHAASSGGNARAYRSYLDYDSFHRLARQSTPKSTSLAAGELIWSAAFFDANDNLAREVGPHFGSGYTGAGAVTTHAYDVMDRQTLSTGPDTSADPAGERTAFAYDDAGRLTKTTLPKGILTPAIADDFATLYAYDALDRVVRQTRHLMTTAGAITSSLHTHACYDALNGDMVQLTTPRANLATVTCAAPVEANSTTFTYDAAHRPTSETDPLGHRQQTAYDANSNPVARTDAAGSVSHVVFDQRNLPAKIIEPFGAGVGGRAITTLIEYDPVGNRSRMISPRAWDVANGGPTFTQYVTRYVYDALNRLSRVDLPTDTAYPTQHYVHIAYDPNGNLLWNSLPVTTASAGSVAAGSKTQMTYWDPGWIATSDAPDTTPRVHFDYRAEGWQRTRTPELVGGGLNTDEQQIWTHFADGMLAERKDRDGQLNHYAYDANNNLLTARDASGILADARSAIDVEATWDSLDRLTKVRSKEEDEDRYRFTTYAYDLNFNVTRRDDDGLESQAGTAETAGRRNDYTYDAADWLTTQLDHGASTATGDDQRITNTFTPNGWEASRLVARNNGSGTYVPKQTTTWTHFLNGQLRTLLTKNGAGTTTWSLSNGVV